MASTFTTNLQLEKIADNEQENTWGTTQRTDQDNLDKAIAGIGTWTSTGGTNTVSDADFLYQRVVLSGTLASNVVHLIPADRAKRYDVNNNHSQGTFTVQFQPSGGTAVTLPEGYDGPVFSDGTTATIPGAFVRGTVADTLLFNAGAEFQQTDLGTTTGTTTVDADSDSWLKATLGADSAFVLAAPTSGYGAGKVFKIIQGTGANTPTFYDSTGTNTAVPINTQTTWLARGSAAEDYVGLVYTPDGDLLLSKIVSL